MNRVYNIPCNSFTSMNWPQSHQQQRQDMYDLSCQATVSDCSLSPQLNNGSFLSNTQLFTNLQMGAMNHQLYQPIVPFEHQSAASITTESVTPRSTRKPKTYHCPVCDTWLTTAGHLRRHFKTNMHVNAVRTSGKQDPATLPIKSFHLPTGTITTNLNGNPTLNNQQGIGSQYTNQLSNFVQYPSYVPNGIQNDCMFQQQPLPAPSSLVWDHTIQNPELCSLANGDLTNQVEDPLPELEFEQLKAIIAALE